MKNANDFKNECICRLRIYHLAYKKEHKIISNAKLLTTVSADCKALSCRLFRPNPSSWMANDVVWAEVVQNASGPLLVEIDKLPGNPLGVTLTQGCYRGRRVFYIDSVAAASIADRSVYSSGVTRVAVTRGGNWGCHPYFFLKKLTTFFAHHCHFYWFPSDVTPLEGVTRGGPPVTPLQYTIRWWGCAVCQTRYETKCYIHVCSRTP